MKATGIVRKIDSLGRFSLPKELRRSLGISECGAVEIYVDGDQIILKKHEPDCVFCGEAKDVIEFKGKLICPKCLKGMETTYDDSTML